MIVSSSESDSMEGSEEGETSVDLEPWPDFLRRTAQLADAQLEHAGVSQWAIEWRRRKWKWAAELGDTNNLKWSATSTKWQPLVHSGGPCARRQARPKKRWDQDLVDFLRHELPDCAEEWREVAQNKLHWESMAEDFANFAA